MEGKEKSTQRVQMLCRIVYLTANIAHGNVASSSGCRMHEWSYALNIHVHL